MDKNKNRTDLLAAGRKRLQQFRKKKDGKGNKSSGKASNSEVESDADPVSADKAELVPPQILDQEGSLKNEPDAQNAAFLVPSSEDQNQTIAINDHLSAPPVIPDTDSDTTSLARNVELLTEENVSTELSDGNDQTFDSLSPHHVKDMNVVEEPSSNDSRSLECVVSEDDSAHSAVLGIEDSSNQEYFVDTTESVRVDGTDQVTDIGAIQGGDYLALQQIIKDNEVVVKDEGAIQGGDYLAFQQMIKDNEVVVKDDGMLGLPGSGETVERTAGMSKGETNMEDPNSGVCSRIDIIDVLESSSESNEVKEVPELLQGTLILPPSEPLTVTADISRVIDEDKRSYSQSLLPDSHVIERIKEQLYLMTCAGDIDRTQLAEESKLQVDFDQEHRQVLLEVSSAANSVTKVRWMNKSLCEELAKCKSDLEAAVDVKNKLETQFNAQKSELVEITIRAEGLHVELERSHEASTRQLAEIAGYKNLVSGLQSKIDTLNGNLTSSVDSENKLTEDMLILRRENEKLLATLVECKDSLKSLQVEHANLNDNLVQTSLERRKIEDVKDGIACENDKLLAELKECKALLDVVQVENDTLNRNIFSALETNKELAEEKSHFSTQSEKLLLELAHYKDLLTGLQLEHCNALNELKEAKCVIEERLEDNIRLSLPREEKMKLSPSHVNDPEPPFVHIDLKGQLEEAEKLIKLLDNTIENIHSHSMYLGTSSRKTVAPVSKLIQAFESKAHHDDCDEEVVSSSENKIHVYSILSAKEQLNSLGNVFKELMRYSMDAITYQKNLADVPLGELNVSYEALKEHCDSCEAKSIENVVLSELFKLHWIENIEAQKVELLGLYDTIRQHSTNVETDNIKLVSRIGVCQSRTVELEKKIEEMLISSDEMVLSVTKKVDVLCTEVAERDLNHDQVIQSVRQLNVLVGSPCCSKTLETVSNDLDLIGFVTVSIDAATDFIKNLQEDLEACKIDQETLKSSYMDLVGKCNDVRGKNELATDILHHLRSKLNKIVLDASSTAFEENNPVMEESENFLDPLHIYNYDSLVEQITVLLNGRLQLESENHKLRSELIYRENLVEELKKRSLDSDAILHLIEDVEGKLKLDGSCFDSDKLETHLQYLISFLFQKYEEADDELCLSRESSISHGMEISLLEGKIESLSFVVAQHENEIIVLKESLRQGREAFVALEAELQGKINEVEQSEQRVSSIREKLSIAVSKGKGLIVQRDSLKQSLAETSSELDRYLKELQLKDSMLEEVEAKLKTYSEAGERVEALESELSYIRNSATALRESFISKDSVLQRIEEMLEDLELPENLYSGDIIEKVDWLARSVAGNALLPLTTDSYTDAVVVGDDSWKEDVHGLDNNDLRKKYEELQSKFYGLAEQNDMLEQSLLERNNVVQRWEEMIDRVNMPLQLRSMEPEDRIEWLANALSASHQHCDSLQHKVDHLETCYNAVTADLDQSHTRVTDLDTALRAITIEKNHFLQNLDSVTSNYDRALETVAKLEFENDKLQNEATALQKKLLVKVNDFEMKNTKLQNEVTALQKNLAEKVRSCQLIEGEIKRLEDLVSSVLQDGDLLTNGSKGLGQLLQKLVEQYSTLALQNTAVSVTKGGNTITEEEAGAINVEQRAKEDDIVGLKNVNASRDELEEALCALVRVKEERDKYLEMNQSLVREVEALDSKEQELQELLRQEEQKSVSVREKLNVAVRKGKSLVQHRDSLKQAIEELNSEVERLKSDIKIQEISHVDYEQKVKDLSSNKERVEVLESEIVGLKNLLQEKTRTLSMIVDTLNGFDVTLKNVVDPLEKLNIISKRWQELHVASENNFNKAKRSAELLVAELNEVQERNDLLQEELSQVHHDISELSTARDFAEASKHEAILQLEKLSSLHYNERNSQLVELFAIKSCLTELIDSFYNVNEIVGTVLYKQVQYLYNLETSLKSSLEPNSADVGVVSLGDPRSLFPINSENRENLFLPNSLSESEMQKCVDGNRITEVCGLVGSHMQVFLKEVNVLKEEFYKHSIELEKRAKHLYKVGSSVCREVISQKQFIIENSIRLENIEKERDEESIAMRKNLSLLFEACSSSVLEIENWKSQFVGSSLTTEDIQRYDSSIDLLSSGECCRTLADKLSFSVKELINFQTEIVEDVYKDMKVTITNLQKELQEKDIRKDRICVEFVSQIREAESAARSHLQDSKLAKSQLDDVKRRLEVIEEESNLLKQRIQEFEDDDTLKELDERARSLNSVLVAKEQEIEALMQALDEEERQMEEQTNKILELERVMQQKNSELENMEASSVKVKKKLSVTVSKFDELHHLSRSLLSEVEKLQCGVRERDEEISFLRQEVTRCTNDALLAAASQISDKRNSSEEMLHDLVTWLKSVYPGNIENDPRDEMNINNNNNNNYKELLHNQIGALLSQMEDLKAMVQSKDMMLQVEKAKVEDLMRKGESLENTLRNKDSQLSRNSLGNRGWMDSSTSEIIEAEPLMNTWSVTGTSIAPQVRTLRKANNDQVAIAIDTNNDSGNKLENDDDDDDKAHGFKSLTTSRIVPRFSRPVTDMIDGLWVSCDRTLMRQPALRLGVIIYWAVMHALLATFVV